MRKIVKLSIASLLSTCFLVGCKGGDNPDPRSSLKDLKVTLTKEKEYYYVDESIRNTDFKVTATYLDDYEQVISRGQYQSNPDLYYNPYIFTDDDLKDGKLFTFTYLNKTASILINLKKTYCIDWCAHPIDGQGNNLYYYASKCQKIVFGDLTTTIPEGCSKVFNCEEGAPNDEWNLRAGIKAYYKPESEDDAYDGELYVICKGTIYFEDDDRINNENGPFGQLKKLDSLDLTNADFSKHTNMRGMFNNCAQIKSLDLSNFNTASATDMYSMFYHCDALSSLDLTNFDTSKVTNMSCMFAYCSNLETLNVSSFNTSNVKSMELMFRDCSKLSKLDLTKFDTSKVETMKEMFYNCNVLKALDLTNFKTLNVTDMSYMFSWCSELATLNLSDQFTTSKVTTMTNMFSGIKVTSLDLTNFNTSNVTDMGYMFSGCELLNSLKINNFDTSNVETMNDMFNGCKAIGELDLSSFATSKVNNMQKIFCGCSALSKIIVSEDQFVVDQLTYDDDMFAECSTALQGEKGTVWSTGNPTNKTYAHIDGGTSNPGYFWSKN